MKLGLTDYLFELMSDGMPWTFWDLQETMSRRYGCFYGEPTISAGLRTLRHYDKRKKFDLPLTGEILLKERTRFFDGTLGRGYQYRLIKTSEFQYNLLTEDVL